MLDSVVIEYFAVAVVILVILGGVSSFITSRRLASDREERWRRFEEEIEEEIEEEGAGVPEKKIGIRTEPKDYEGESSVDPALYNLPSDKEE